MWSKITVKPMSITPRFVLYNSIFGTVHYLSVVVVEMVGGGGGGELE